MVSPVDNPSVYTDLAGLNDISKLGRESTPEGLKKVAQQFESMFLNIMLKAMRDSTKSFSEGNYLQSNELEFHQQNFDNQMSVHLSEGAGIGLADVLYEQMLGQFGLEQSAAKTAGQPFELPTRSPIPTAPSSLNPRASVTPGTVPNANIGPTLAASVTHSAHLQAAPLPELTAPQYSQAAMPIESLRAALAARSLPEIESPHVRTPNPKAEPLESPEEFVATLFPAAQKVAERIGVDPRVLLAQSALETGWGKRMITNAEGGNSFNLFGIKADARWGGDRATVMTTEFENGVVKKEHASFRAYESYEESFNDYVDFLESNPRYQQALANSHDPEAFAQHLQSAGYATDPVYAAKISRVMNSNTMSLALSDMTKKVL